MGQPAVVGIAAVDERSSAAVSVDHALGRGTEICGRAVTPVDLTGIAVPWVVRVVDVMLTINGFAPHGGVAPSSGRFGTPRSARISRRIPRHDLRWVRSQPVLGCALCTLRLDGHPLRNPAHRLESIQRGIAMATTATATKKSNKGRKSAAIALAVVGVAGLSLASAAQLTINNSSLGAGTSVVAPCDKTGITVGYTNTYAAT